MTWTSTKKEETASPEIKRITRCKTCKSEFDDIQNDRKPLECGADGSGGGGYSGGSRKLWFGPCRQELDEYDPNLQDT